MTATPPTLNDLPMGGCSTSAAHYAHLEAGDPLCENQREQEEQPEPEAWNPALYVSYSSLTLHRQCPQAWSYRYLRGLDRLGTAVARDLGSWWHLVRAMDALRRGLSMDSLRSVPKELSTGDSSLVLTRVGYDPTARIPLPASGSVWRLPNDKTVPASSEAAIAIAAAWWRTLPSEDKDAWIEESGEPLPDRLAYMEARYAERWADDFAAEVPLAVEHKFKREVPNGSGAVLPGVVDLIYLDTRRNLVVVRDAKSSKTLAAADSADDLSDSQVHLYGWGVSEEVEEWGHGPVAALSYDRARSAPPKQPAVTQTAGGLSKSVTDYDLHTYLEWAKGPDGEGVPWGTEGEYVKTGKRAGEPKFGRYTAEESVIERLSHPAAQSVWFQRTLTPLNRNIVRAHLQAVGHTQREAERTMAYFSEHGEAPRNFNRRMCSWCDFRALCRAELLGGPRGEYDPAEYGLTARDRS